MKSNLSFIFAGFFYKSDVNQRYGYNSEEENNLRLGNLRSQINHNSFLKSSACIERYIETIAATRLNVKINTSRVAKTTTIQAAQRLEKTAEKTLSWESVNSTLRAINIILNNSWEIRKNQLFFEKRIEGIALDKKSPRYLSGGSYRKLNIAK